MSHRPPGRIVVSNATPVEDEMQTTEQATPVRAGGSYVDVNGVPTYYEATGTGDPVVLLHGGMCTAETWDPQTSALADHYRVYVPERYAHGRTRDVEGPLSYEDMATHTIGFLEATQIGPAHLIGWSDGALVALLLALRRPALVRKLVFVDQYVTLDGAPEGLLPYLTSMTVESIPPAFAEPYRALSPDGPQHLPVVVDKLRALWGGPTGVELDDLARVNAPTLVLASDDGGMPLTHLAEVQRALPDCQIAVVPGTSHGLTLEKPHIVNALIQDFLADEQAPKLFAHEAAT
jgi:pimeloyl-ACP methyl ester carboxylesterase